MIAGTFEIDHAAKVLQTSNDSYPLDGKTVFSVVRPFRPMGWLVGCMLAAFGVSFHDLLWMHEIAISGVLSFGVLAAGETVAQLVLVNRDLRGSDLSVAAWGSYADLNEKRRELSEVARSCKNGEDAA